MTVIKLSFYNLQIIVLLNKLFLFLVKLKFAHIVISFKLISVIDNYQNNKSFFFINSHLHTIFFYLLNILSKIYKAFKKNLLEESFSIFHKVTLILKIRNLETKKLAKAK